jgi:hypothetical protein
MLNRIKPFRKHINIIILVIGIFMLINFALLFFSNIMAFNNTSSATFDATFRNSTTYMALFGIGLFAMMPFAIIEGEFRRQDLLDAIKNKK